jgi:phosphate uptake regulator
MKRKVIQLAGKTLVVSIPSKWAELRRIRKGDEINLEEQGKRLILTTEKEASGGSIKLHITEKMPFLKRYLRMLYQLGYEEVTLTSDTSLPFDKIGAALSEMLGFEIVDNREKYCLIRNIAKGSSEEFDVVYRRLFSVIGSMMKDIKEAIEQQRHDSLQMIKLTEKTADKIANFCYRIINTKNLDDPKNQIAHTAHCLEWIGDNLEELCDIIKNNPPTKKQICLFSDIITYFEKVAMLRLNIASQEVVKAKNMGEKIIREALSMLRDEKSPVFTHYCMTITEKIQFIEFTLVPNTELS